MARFEYIPEDGKGKAVSVYGFRSSPKPLKGVFGKPIQKTDNAIYYVSRKSDGDKVCEATTSESRRGFPRSLVITVCSNDAAYVDANIGDVLKRADMIEVDPQFDDIKMKRVLAYLEKGFRDFMKEIGA